MPQCEIKKLPFFRSLFDRKIPYFYAGFHSHAEDKIKVCTTERRLSELRKKSRSFSLSIYEEGWSKHQQLFKFILSLICNILSENHNSTIWRPFKNAFKTLWGVVASTRKARPSIHNSHITRTIKALVLNSVLNGPHLTLSIAITSTLGCLGGQPPTLCLFM